MEEKRRLQDNLEKVVSSVPEMREEKERLAKERDKLERELERQRYLARELQDQVSIFSSLDQVFDPKWAKNEHGLESSRSNILQDFLKGSVFL